MTASISSFNRVKSSNLYEMPYETGWCAYLLADGAQVDSISIQDSLDKYEGHYIFALRARSFSTEKDVERFTEDVCEYLDDRFAPTGLKFNGRACLWIQEGDFKEENCPAFSFGRTNVWLMQSDFNLILGANITLTAHKNCTIRSTDIGLKLEGLKDGDVRFLTSPIDGNGPSIDPNEMVIPFTGQYSGCLLISGKIGSHTLEFFKAGLCFRHGSGSDLPTARQVYPVIIPGGDFEYAGSIDPLDPFNYSDATIIIADGRLRTLFTPLAKDGKPLTFKSWLRTSSGQGISLRPIGSFNFLGQPAPNSGSLVFERIGGTKPDQSIEVHLSFAGDFALAIDGTQGSADDDQTTYSLLCGLFGSEALIFRPYKEKMPYDLLRFVPRSPAYAPAFPISKASLDDPGKSQEKPRLDYTYMTSWMTLIDGEGGHVAYTAQPESSPLFHASTSNAAFSKGPSMLGAFSPEIKLPQTKGFAFPMVPYSGLGSVKSDDSFVPEDLGTFESQILAPARKQLIKEAVLPILRSHKTVRAEAAMLEMKKHYTTTQQGLLATVEDGPTGANYLEVILARFEAQASRSLEMAFLNPDAELQNLFQTNQLFAVVTNPTHLGKLKSAAEPEDDGEPIFENSVTISGWTMEANVGKGVMSTSYRNVMILKFCEGSLSEMMSSPLKWTDADDFSIAEDGERRIALLGLAQWLQGFVNDSLSEANERGNPLYRNFARIVTDPNWNGILVLRADVDPTGFPDQMKGLAGGIDLTTFEAHHFGISASKVKVDGSNIDIDGSSSLFGLIDYQHPQFRQNIANGGNPDLPIGVTSDGSYGFTVLQLQALFQNSVLKDFRSRVQLTANELFGSAVRQTYDIFGPAPTNAVVLKGSYQSQNGVSTYVMEQDKPTIFSLDSNIFNAVTFNRVQFNTQTAGGGDEGLLRSRFLIWGSLNFASLKDNDGHPFDVLSFGMPNETPPKEAGKGLAFSGLEIEFSSSLSTPNALLFKFKADNLAFDLASSQARMSSLFSTFALQLESFLAMPEDKRPSDLGFIPVSMSIPLKALSGPWFGVVYKIPMGTPGALAEKIGFESRLLMAWAPLSKASDSPYAAFVGIQLPGAAPGAKLISIQGILKISIDKIELLYEAVKGGTEKAFNLRLSNIGLKFMGIAKLPPGASINFFLFGDPEGNGNLGWYAAYRKDAKGEEAQVPLKPLNAGMLLDNSRHLLGSGDDMA